MSQEVIQFKVIAWASRLDDRRFWAVSALLPDINGSQGLNMVFATAVIDDFGNLKAVNNWHML